MKQHDHERLELGSSGSAVRHAILFFPLRLLVMVLSGLGSLFRGRKPRAPVARFDGLSEDAIVSRLGENHGDDLHLLRAFLAKGGAGRVLACWTRISDTGRESVVAHSHSRALRWSTDVMRVCERALEDSSQVVVAKAEQALCERTMEWIEKDHPSLADPGAFSRPPSSLDCAYLQNHVDRWRARNRPSLTKLADEVERRLRRANELRGMLNRWHSFPKDGGAVARPSFAVTLRVPAKLVVASQSQGEELELPPMTCSGTLRVSRSGNYAADASPVPAKFELTLADADGHRWRIEVELDDLGIFSGSIEETTATTGRFFTDADPAWQASFWENLAIHPTMFALEGSDGESFSLPGRRKLVVSDSELVAYAVAVMNDSERAPSSRCSSLRWGCKVDRILSLHS